MKTLLTLVVLFFSSSVVAEDISDFQIEGMSIGDSLLDYFGEEEITKIKKKYEPKSKKFYRIIYYSNLEEYDALTINMKSNDDRYIIYNLTGNIRFENMTNMTNCELKRKNIETEISQILKNSKKEEYKYNYPNDTSISTVTDFKVNGGKIRTWCTDYSTFAEEDNFKDHLGVNLTSSIFLAWLETAR
jgi:hypothetical protein